MKPTETPKPPEETKSITPPADEKTTLLNEKDGEEKKEEAKKPEGAPEKYEPWKAPEGFTLDEAVAKDVDGLFKKMNLSQAQGQELVDFYAKQMQDAAKAPFEFWENMNKEWKAKIDTHPEMGGKIPEIRATIGKALDSLGSAQLTKEFREAMDLTGAGNNPAFVLAFWKLAQKVTEGSHVSGAGPSKFGQNAPGTTERPTAAKALYPNLP